MAESEGPRQGGEASFAAAVESLAKGTLPLIYKPERPYFALLSILTLALFGTLAFSRDSVTARLLGGGILAIWSVVAVFLYRRSLAADKQRPPENFVQRRVAAEKVNGTWWQVILTGRRHGGAQVIGLTSVEFRLAVLTGAYGLDGTRYGRDGSFEARWAADAVALQVGQDQTVQVFYRFGGTSFREETESVHGRRSVTGIGSFDFPVAVSASKAPRGSGWFATGDVEQLSFGARRDVQLLRMTESEAAVMNTDTDPHRDRQTLVADKYLEFDAIFQPKVDHRRIGPAG